MNIHPDCHAWTNHYRVVVFDSFDHECAVIGDYRNKQDALDKAKSIGGPMTVAYVHDDTGAIVGKYGSY